MVMICLNMLVMMIQHHGQSEEVVLTMNILLTRLPIFFLLMQYERSSLAVILVHPL